MSARRRVLWLAIMSLLCPAATAADLPGAFELLDRVRRAYSALDIYTDLGEIERTAGHGDEEHTTLQFFELAVGAEGAFQWRTHGETAAGFEERVVWTDGPDAYVYSGLLEQYKPIPSVAAELAHGFGEGSYEALLVPLLLAGEGEVLANPDAAVVEAVEPCGKASCWVLSMTRMGGTIETELRIDQESSLIREVRVRLEGSAAVFSQAVAEAGLGRSLAQEAHDEGLEITVRHHPAAAPPAAFQAPDDARRVTEWEPEGSDASEAEDPWLDFGFQEEITVALFSVVARIVDSRGEPLLGLEPGDLIARIGAQEVPILSLDWLSSHHRPSEVPSDDLAEQRAPALAGDLTIVPAGADPAGRLVVLFLQVDLEPSRIAGHLKILPDVEDLLRALHPEDRVAIVSFDSHLKLWLDFTRDRDAAFATLREAIGYGTPAARRSRDISLLAMFDNRAADDAASPEKALQVTAEALAPLPGEKDLVYLGWGLGRYGAGGVRMTPDYEPAVRALDAARATVFVLDVTQADQHSLEVGLQNVAAHTGGTYSRTFHFASQAVHRLARTLGGHYVVSLDRSSLPDARGRLSLGLRNRRGTVLFKPLTLG